jgi:hypothetical protein
MEMLDLAAKHPHLKTMPEFSALIEALRRRRANESAIQERTVSEEETHLRRGIAESCRSIDSQKGWEFGTAQLQLFRLTRKSIKEMTVAELRNAAAKIKNIRA